MARTGRSFPSRQYLRPKRLAIAPVLTTKTTTFDAALALRTLATATFDAALAVRRIAQTNLISNSDFEVDTAGWTGISSGVITRDTSSPYSGVASGKIAVGAGLNGAGAEISFTSVVGVQYTISARVKTSVALKDVQLRITGASSGGSVITNPNTSYTLMTVTGVANTVSNTLQIFDQANAGAGYDIYIDEVTVVLYPADASVLWDAALSLRTTKTTTFDAALALRTLSTTTFDAALANPAQKTATFDAALGLRVEKTMTFDAVLLNVTQKTATFDAALGLRTALSLTWDASLSGTAKPTVTFDAALANPRIVNPTTITNGTFEVNSTGWNNNAQGVVARSTAQAHSGVASGSITSSGAGSNNFITGSGNIVTGAPIPQTLQRFEIWVLGSGATIGKTFSWQVNESGGAFGDAVLGGITVPTVVLTAGWQKIVFEATPTRADRTSMYAFGSVPAAGASEVYYVDDYVAPGVGSMLFDAALAYLTQAFSNYFLYSGFEAGIVFASYGGATVTQSTDQAHSGTQSAKIVVPSGAFAGGRGTSVTSSRMRVDPGDRASGSMWVYSATPIVDFTMGIEFFNAAGSYISGSYTTTNDHTGSGWEQFSILGATAPAGAASATFMGMRNNDATARTFYIDDVMFNRGTSVLPYIENGASYTLDPTWDAALALRTLKTTTFDAALATRTLKTTTWDAALGLRTLKTMTFDAALEVPTQKTVTFDAALALRTLKTTTWDAALGTYTTKTATFDAALGARLQLTATFDAVLGAFLTKTTTWDAALGLRTAQPLTWDAIIGVIVPPHVATAAEISAALSGNAGPVLMRIRYEQRDHNFEYQDDLTDAIEQATVTLDNFRAITRTANFRIRATRLPETFDRDNDHIAVFAELKVLEEWVRFPLGLFHLDQVRESPQPNAHEFWDASAADVIIHLFEDTIDQPYTVPEGALYTAVVEQLILSVGIRTNVAASTVRTPKAQTWPPGKSKGEIINDLLDGINYFPIWADPYGIATSRERIDPFLEEAAITYSTLDEPKMLRPDFSRVHERGRYMNRIIVTVADPNRTPFSVQVTNDDEDSPVSTVNKRAVTSENKNADRAASEALMAQIGAYLLRDASVRAQVGSLSTHPDPRRDAHEFYTVVIEDAEVATHWRVEGWTFDCKTGATMQHRIGRASRVDVTTEVLAAAP